VIGVPIGITQIILGNVWQGIIILLGYVLVVANIDYFLRPRMTSKQAHLTPVLILLSAFGGLHLFGFLGVIYGPVIMIFLVTTIEIYLEHFRMAKANESIASQEPSASFYTGSDPSPVAGNEPRPDQ
jgi:predicted PurR-regulated permease PerM